MTIDEFSWSRLPLLCQADEVRGDLVSRMARAKHTAAEHHVEPPRHDEQLLVPLQGEGGEGRPAVGLLEFAWQKCVVIHDISMTSTTPLYVEASMCLCPGRIGSVLFYLVHCTNK